MTRHQRKFAAAAKACKGHKKGGHRACMRRHLKRGRR